jgi:hypothetical protein
MTNRPDHYPDVADNAEMIAFFERMLGPVT